MIHSDFNFPTMMLLLAISLGVGYGAWRRREHLWALGCAGFALFLLWPAWPQEAYQALRSFITLNPEGAKLLAAVVFCAVCAYGLKHIIFGDKRTKNKHWF